MKVLRVQCHVETVCPECGQNSSQMGLAEVLPDGRIGDGKLAGDLRPCNACLEVQRERENKEYYDARRRKAWAKKHGHLKFTRGESA